MLFGDVRAARSRTVPASSRRSSRCLARAAARRSTKPRRAADDAANRGDRPVCIVHHSDARRAVRHRLEVVPRGTCARTAATSTRVDPTGAGRGGFVVTGSGSSDGSGDRFGASSSETIFAAGFEPPRSRAVGGGRMASLPVRVAPPPTVTRRPGIQADGWRVGVTVARSPRHDTCRPCLTSDCRSRTRPRPSPSLHFVDLVR